MYAIRVFIASVLLAVASFTAPEVADPPPVSQTNEIPAYSATVASKPVVLPSTTTTAPPPTTTTVPLPPPTTTTTEAPAPQPASAGECGGYVPIIEMYWPADQVAKVCDVMDCETAGSFDPTEDSNEESTASGLLQFVDGTWRDARQYVRGAEGYARAAHAPAEVQIAVGAAWWSRTSWQQWECA